MKKIIFSILLIATTTFITTVHGLTITTEQPDDLPLTINFQRRSFLITDHSQEINLDGSPIVIRDLASLTLCVKGVTYRPHKWCPYYDTISHFRLTALTIMNPKHTVIAHYNDDLPHFFWGRSIIHVPLEEYPYKEEIDYLARNYMLIYHPNSFPYNSFPYNSFTYNKKHKKYNKKNRKRKR